MYQFGGEEDFRGPGLFPGMEQGNAPEIDFITPDGIDYNKFMEYLRSQGVTDISEIMGGGTPGENDLVIDGADRDSPLAQIYASIIGRAEGVDPAVLQDEQMRVLNNSGIGAVAEQIAAAGGYDNWLAQQEGEITDINEDTLPGDTTSGDTTIGGGEEGEQEEQEGWLDRLSNWWDSVVSSVGSGASGSTPPTLPGSAGVIISPGSAGMSWPDIITNPGAWQVYLPGVIPGLPQSPTIIGTIEDILSSPGEVLGDLWDQIENTVANPGEFLEDLLNGVVDEDGLITIGGISTVVGTIYDDLFGDDDDTAIAPGGAEEEEEEEEDERQGEIIVEFSDTKGGSQMGTAPVMDPIQPQPQPEIGGSGQAPISDEPQPELGGAGNVVDSVSAGGGGGGMMRRGQPHFGGVPYGLPQGEMILYRPPTANEILTDFTNGLAIQRKRGMLV